VKRKRILPATLPNDVLADGVLWAPDAAESQAFKNWRHAKHELGRLVALRHRWARQERKHDAFIDAQHRRFSAELNAAIADEKRVEELRAARDKEIEWRKAYYLGELDKEIKAADERRRKAAKEILERIHKDNARLEREELTRRGVVRGRR
jgi:hypothetical protein